MAIRKLLTLLIAIIAFSCNSQHEELYQKSDLQKSSLKELRVMRNEIFAKHGYIFKDQDLTEYFSQFDWYKPTEQNVDNLLTENDKANINLILQVESEITNSLIATDPRTVENYKNYENTSNKKFIDRLIKTVLEFKDRKADTTVLQICNIDNLGKLDTIKNNIYYSNDTVIVNSSWTKNGQKLWEAKIKNPYLWINDADEFQYDTRKPWVTFTIGIYYAIPDIKSINYYSHINKQTVLQAGLKWAKRENIKMSKDEYSKYLSNFKGDIISYGDPENRMGLLIWYEPVKKFIPFYMP